MRSGIRLVRSALFLFDRGVRVRFYFISAVFAVLALVDTFALVLVAVLTSVAVKSEGGRAAELPAQVRQFTDAVGLGSSATVGALLTAVILLMFGKSVLGAVFTRWSLRFLARQDVALGVTLLGHQLGTPWLSHIQRDQGETLRDALWGPTVVVQEFLGSVLLSWGEVSTIGAVALAVLLIEPLVGIVGGIYLGLLAVVLQLAVRRRTMIAGERMFDASALVNKTVLQALNTYKELLVRRRTSAYSDLAANQRGHFADAFSEMMFVSALSRYVLEGGLVIGIGVIALAATLFGSGAYVATSMVLFVTAGFRALPAMHKLQLNVATVRFRVPYVRAIELELAEHARDLGADAGTGTLEEERLQGDLQLQHLTVSYPGIAQPAVQGVSAMIALGSRVALVGPSGSGKTTIADAVLGLLAIEKRAITVGGIDIFDALPQWRRSVGYVPQDVVIIDDTVAANVALGWMGDQIDYERVWWALTKAQADQFVRGLPQSLETELGERGLKIAGGQRQRIGIARALYTRPTFLVLDEATSALDAQTERLVMDAIDRLHGDVTVLVIAHRLATVRSADLVVYLEEGTVRAQGTFTDVVAVEPHFAEHARLSGLV